MNFERIWPPYPLKVLFPIHLLFMCNKSLRKKKKHQRNVTIYVDFFYILNWVCVVNTSPQPCGAWLQEQIYEQHESNLTQLSTAGATSLRLPAAGRLSTNSWLWLEPIRELINVRRPRHDRNVELSSTQGCLWTLSQITTTTEDDSRADSTSVGVGRQNTVHDRQWQDGFLFKMARRDAMEGVTNTWEAFRRADFSLSRLGCGTTSCTYIAGFRVHGLSW